MPFSLEEIRDQHKISDVIGRFVKLKRMGREFVGLSPFNKEKTPSFTVNDDKKFFHCFSSGRHGDVFDFLMMTLGVTLPQACEILGGTRKAPGTMLTPRAMIEREPPIISAPVPPNHEPFEANKPISAWNRGSQRFTTWTPNLVWPYRDAGGSLTGYIVRINKPEGGKDFFPLRPTIVNGNPEWTWCGFDKPRPLYNLDKIPPTGPVLLVEGEKDADAASHMWSRAALAWPGGVNAVAQIDFTPLKGREVILWLDADQPGHDGALSAAKWIAHAGASRVDIIPWDVDRPKGWGAADAEDEGWGYFEMVDHLKTAQEYIPDGSPTVEELEGEAEEDPTFAFNVTFFEDIPDEHHKEWMVKDIFGKGEFSIVYGAPGCGKSVLIGDAAAHVAAGLEWFGHKVKPCTVIYVAAERSALVKRRMAAFRKRHGIDALPLVVLDGLFNLATDLTHAEEIKRIARFAIKRTGLPVGWIIIDTKAQVMGGADENASKDISVLNNNIAYLQQDGVAVTVVDHTPQADGKRMKGNGGLAGAADGSFLVQKDGGSRTLTIGSKAPNDGPDDLTIRFKLEGVLLGTNSEGEETYAPVVVEAEPDEMDPDKPISKSPSRLGSVQKSVMTALETAKQSGQGLGFTRLMSMSGIQDKGSFGRAIRELVLKGMVEEKEINGNKFWMLL